MISVKSADEPEKMICGSARHFGVWALLFVFQNQIAVQK